MPTHAKRAGDHAKNGGHRVSVAAGDGKGDREAGALPVRVAEQVAGRGRLAGTGGKIAVAAPIRATAKSRTF